MDVKRLIERTWLADFGDRRIVAYAELPDDDLLISVTEISELGDVFPIVLFNTRLLEADFQGTVWDKLKEFDPGIDTRAQEAGVDLRGVLVRIMDTAWTWAHISSDSPELRLSLLEGWRGLRLLARTSDMLLYLARECVNVQVGCGESQDVSPVLS